MPRKKFDDTFSRFDTIRERDRQTDGHTDTGQQQRPRLRIASHAKTNTLIIENDSHGSLSAVTHAPFHASMLRPASQAGPMHDSK